MSTLAFALAATIKHDGHGGVADLLSTPADTGAWLAQHHDLITQLLGRPLVAVLPPHHARSADDWTPAAPAVSVSPGRSVDLGRSGESGRSVERGGSVSPGRSADPGRSAGPGVSVDVGRAVEPGHSVERGGSVKPGRSADPDGSVELGRSVEPGGSGSPGRSARLGRSAEAGGSFQLGGSLVLGADLGAELEPLQGEIVRGAIVQGAIVQSELLKIRRAVRALFARAVAPGPPSKADADRLMDAQDALRMVNRAADRLGALQLEWPADGQPVTRWALKTEDPVALLVGAIGRSTIDFLAGPDRGRLRACPAARCVKYFLQDDPRQTWCSPSCGNRERVNRAYRKRQAR